MATVSLLVWARSANSLFVLNSLWVRLILAEPFPFPYHCFSADILPVSFLCFSESSLKIFFSFSINFPLEYVSSCLLARFASITDISSNNSSSNILISYRRGKQSFKHYHNNCLEIKRIIIGWIYLIPLLVHMF